MSRSRAHAIHAYGASLKPCAPLGKVDRREIIRGVLTIDREGGRRGYCYAALWVTSGGSQRNGSNCLSIGVSARWLVKLLNVLKARPTMTSKICAWV